MRRYSDIDPQDIDPEINRPYSNYSTSSLDTSFHDHEMEIDDDFEGVDNRELLKRYRAGDDEAGEELLRRQSEGGL